MKRQLVWLMAASLLILVAAWGCAKKTVLKEDAVSQKQEVAAQKATQPQVAARDKAAPKEVEAKKPAESGRAEKETAVKGQKEKEKASTQDAKKPGAGLAAADKMYELTDVRFDFDKYNLKDEARTAIDKHALWLQKNKQVKIVVEGHCDEKGTAEYNLALGERRAHTVAKYLSDLGIDAGRITTISYGFERPLDPKHDDDARAKNRRAHFVASGTK